MSCRFWVSVFTAISSLVLFTSMATLGYYVLTGGASALIPALYGLPLALTLFLLMIGLSLPECR